MPTVSWVTLWDFQIKFSAADWKDGFLVLPHGWRSIIGFTESSQWV